MSGITGSDGGSIGGFHSFQDLLEIQGKGSFETLRFAALGMLERQRMCMQPQAFHEDVCRMFAFAVEGIRDNRESQGCEMCANLMRSTCLWDRFHKSTHPKPVQHP